jgi:HK97 gp10 family phage protein
MGISINVDGIAGILNRLEQLGINVGNVQNNALQAAAAPIAEDAKQNLIANGSVRTGKLLNSIQISKVKRRYKYKYKYIAVFTKDPTAHLVELGHGGPAPADPHPYLAPAFEKNRNNAKEIITNTMKGALK